MRLYLHTKDNLSDQIFRHVHFKILSLGINTKSPVILPLLEMLNFPLEMPLTHLSL
jgi:hypothetical protein